MGKGQVGQGKKVWKGKRRIDRQASGRRKEPKQELVR
jgi:hypothetical protein